MSETKSEDCSAAVVPTTTATTAVTIPHPFARCQNPSRWEIAKMVLGLCTGISIARFLLFLLALAVGTNLALFWHCQQNRYRTVMTLRWTCRCLLFLAGYYRIPVHGKLPSPCPRIVVSNHFSNSEILHLMTLDFRDTNGNPVLPVFVTKESVFGVPFVGKMARDIMGCIGVRRRRRCGDQGSTTKEAILERMKQQNGQAPLAIFPEGTTTNGRSLLAFKTGAFSPMVEVLPIVYSLKMRRHCFVPTYESIWGIAYLWRIFSEFRQEMACTILEPIRSPPSSCEQRERVFADTVRLAMASHSNLPMVSDEYSTYKHKLEYHARLRTAYQHHPRGPKYAMCFEPMQKVWTTENENLVEYDTVSARFILDKTPPTTAQRKEYCDEKKEQ